ncbi:zinc-binding alcohol dehydrogenase family protein [Maribacter sp. X9]|uniref:zinc-binding alcohol dehydrogenase family protein n=1 Tax=Maribacter sp. X9 TaxID=3402159 RepID=UPI003AF3A9BD
MKYIICEEPHNFKLGEKTVPLRAKGEALLRILRVGICGTDLHAYGGNQAFFNYPRILGHELAAEILEIDENRQGLKKGDKVIIMPYVSCGTCIACRNGKPNCCANINVLGVHIDGGMQEIISLRTDLLIPGGNLSLNEMAIIEPLAIGAHAIRRANIQKDETIVVMGCGPIGIGLMKLAQIAGAMVIAMDVNEDRLNYVKKEIGVAYVLNVMDRPKEKISEITNGDMATTVFDATGSRKALESGIDYMSHGGRFVLVGLSKGELTYSHPKIHAKETTLMCSRNATLEDFKFVMDHIKEFPTSTFITHEVHFSEMIENFDAWLLPETGVVKAMVHFDLD